MPCCWSYCIKGDCYEFYGGCINWSGRIWLNYNCIDYSLCDSICWEGCCIYYYTCGDYTYWGYMNCCCDCVGEPKGDRVIEKC